MSAFATTAPRLAAGHALSASPRTAFGGRSLPTHGRAFRAAAALGGRLALPSPAIVPFAQAAGPHWQHRVNLRTRAVADGVTGSMDEELGEIDMEDMEEGDEGWYDDEDQPKWRREVQDSESEEFAVQLAVMADLTKGVDIMVLNVMPLVYWTRYMVLVTAFNKPQLDAVCFRMSQMAQEKYDRVLPEGLPDTSDWMLLDYGDVVVHVFTPPERTRYDMEGFYATAEEVDLPFETERPEELGY